jgi:hypothetical protein
MAPTDPPLDERAIGYRVDAADVPIGNVDELHARGEAEPDAFVVDLCLLDLGQKRVVPMRAVVGVDHELGVVTVSSTSDQVVQAPEFRDDDDHVDDWFDRLVRHYFG